MFLLILSYKRFENFNVSVIQCKRGLITVLEKSRHVYHFFILLYSHTIAGYKIAQMNPYTYYYNNTSVIRQ